MSSDGFGYSESLLEDDDGVINSAVCEDSADDKHDGAHLNSLQSTIISYVCTTVGAGIISLPFGLAEAGWFGLFIIAITATICVQTANWLIACMFHSPGVRLKSYEEVGIAALGQRGKILVAVFQNTTLFGVCAIFLIIAAGNLTAIFPKISVHLWVLMIAAILVPVSWLRTIKEVAPLAWFGFFASLLVGGVVVVRGFQNASNSAHSDAHYPFIKFSGIPTCINVVVFSLGSHSVIPSQVCEMRRAPTEYKKFSLFAYVLIASVYGIVAAAGYAGWGDQADDNILNSIQGDNQGSDSSKTVILIARAAITLHVLLAYPLPLNPVSLFVESQIALDDMPNGRRQVISVALRTVLVIGTMIVALFLPYLGSVLTLVSAMSIVAVALILPPIFYYILFRERGISKFDLAKMAIIVLVGVLSCVIGLYYAITGLVADVRDNPNPFAWI